MKMAKAINIRTIERLKNQYANSKKIWDEFSNALNNHDKKLFTKYFHLRPTTNYIDIVCTYNDKLSMRVSKCKLEDLKMGLEKAYGMSKSFQTVIKMSKKDIYEKFGFKTYEENKYREYNIQAEFITYMQNCDFGLLATEFNIAGGSGEIYNQKDQRGEQRIDILALKNNDIWVIEVKGNDDKTDVVAQVKRYKEDIIKRNIDVVKLLLSNASNTQLDINKDYNVKMGIVHLIGDGNYNVDAVWKVVNFVQTK